MRITKDFAEKEKLKLIWKKRGAILKELRKRRGLKQETMAEILNVSVNSYGLYETGNLPITDDRIVTICEFYGITPNMLLGYETIRVQDIPTALRILADAGVKYSTTGDLTTIPVKQFEARADFGAASGIKFPDKRKSELQKSDFHPDHDDLLRFVNAAQDQASEEMKAVYQALFVAKFRSYLYMMLENNHLQEIIKEFERWRGILPVVPKAVKDGKPVEIDPGSKFDPDKLPAFPETEAEKDGEK